MDDWIRWESWANPQSTHCNPTEQPCFKTQLLIYPPPPRGYSHHPGNILNMRGLVASFNTILSALLKFKLSATERITEEQYRLHLHYWSVFSPNRTKHNISSVSGWWKLISCFVESIQQKPKLLWTNAGKRGCSNNKKAPSFSFLCHAKTDRLTNAEMTHMEKFKCWDVDVHARNMTAFHFQWFDEDYDEDGDSYFSAMLWQTVVWPCWPSATWCSCEVNWDVPTDLHSLCLHLFF